MFLPVAFPHKVVLLHFIHLCLWFLASWGPGQALEVLRSQRLLVLTEPTCVITLIKLDAARLDLQSNSVDSADQSNVCPAGVPKILMPEERTERMVSKVVFTPNVDHVIFLLGSETFLLVTRHPSYLHLLEEQKRLFHGEKCLSRPEDPSCAPDQVGQHHFQQQLQATGNLLLLLLPSTVPPPPPDLSAAVGKIRTLEPLSTAFVDFSPRRLSRVAPVAVPTLLRLLQRRERTE